MSTDFDLLGYSPAQLKKIIADAQAQMAAARANEVGKAREKINAILTSSGLTIDEVFPVRGGRGRKGAKHSAARVPKYRNPKNAEETWSGMGKRPRWLADELAKGAKLEGFAIAAPISKRKAPKTAKSASTKAAKKK